MSNIIPVLVIGSNRYSALLIVADFLFLYIYLLILFFCQTLTTDNAISTIYYFVSGLAHS
jgi:hypothetical protein